MHKYYTVYNVIIEKTSICKKKNIYTSKKKLTVVDLILILILGSFIEIDL